MTVATFIYQNLFCRYLAPGECIIHDRGSEFCNKLMVTMMDSFGVKIRMVCAGRPQGNGQAEKYVDILKEKMKAIMAEISSHKKQIIFFPILLVCIRNVFFNFMRRRAARYLGPNHYAYSTDGFTHRSEYCAWICTK